MAGSGSVRAQLAPTSEKKFVDPGLSRFGDSWHVPIATLTDIENSIYMRQ